MVCNIFYNSKTAKIDSNITNSRKIYGCIEVSVTVFIIFNIPILIRINVRIGGNKKYRFSILFLFQFAK